MRSNRNKGIKYTAVSTDNCPRKRFPDILHMLLKHLELLGRKRIASWQPNGRSFIIHNRDKFTKKVLPSYFGRVNSKKYPKFFKEVKFRSFQ
mmetsp:Transcript_41540/g.50539  ORF Transcript_41540/g.50539 Transcript_41540/m.50539 type:complete len:92 (-) Transcript_41540:262-537(-)